MSLTHYGTLTAANTYFEDERLNSERWDEESSANKTKALKHATRLVDGLNFKGEKADVDQELEFPRGTDTVLPTGVEHACYEVAYALLDGNDVEMDIDVSGEEAAFLGLGRVKNDVNARPIHREHMIPSAVAWQLLRPYLEPGDRLTLSRVD